MSSFNREGTLKSAEKALKQGRIDVAIAEYVKVVEAQPRDWNSANALGDLYVRASQLDKGLAQFTRIADHLSTEGFYSKAAALFKKILKLKPNDEYALIQSADLAARQGTLADAKKHLLIVADLRKKRGDKKGAAEISIRLGTLDPDDLEARLRAAGSAADMGDRDTALREYRDVAARLEKQDKSEEALGAWQAAFDLDRSDEGARARLFASYVDAGASDMARTVAVGSAELKQVAQCYETAGQPDAALDLLGEAAALDPTDVELRVALANAYVARGDVERAKTFLSAETAGTNASLWITLADMELRGGRFDEGRAAVTEALRLDREQAQQAVVVGCQLAESNPDAGYACIEAVADAALAEGDFAAAAVALHEFTIRVRSHLVALMRLVEICVDGDLESTMYEAQAQLADAYLEFGRGLEARIISEDLVAREPWNRANLDRFRRALVMLGETDPDGIIADRLSGDSPFLATEKLDLNEGSAFDTQSTSSSPDAAPMPVAVAGVPDDAGIEPPRPLDQVFGGLRDDVSRQSAEESAAEQYRLAVTYMDMGMVDDAVKALEAAARSPRQRFEAASMLGRLYLDRKDTPQAVEWLERAAEAPAPTPDAGRTLLYDLAYALELTGETGRALAVLVELESESGGFRDVPARIDRLSKVQARG